MLVKCHEITQGLFVCINNIVLRTDRPILRFIDLFTANILTLTQCSSMILFPVETRATSIGPWMVFSTSYIICYFWRDIYTIDN